MTVRNLRQFNQAIDRVAKKLAPAQGLIFLRAVALEVLRRIVQKTPVDTGRARGNWQLTINESPETILERLDRQGNAETIAAATKLLGVNLGATVFITNNLPYIEVLEEGSSAQAPWGMVSITLEEIILWAKGEAQRLQKKRFR